MDDRLHWILSLSALGLWVIAVLALYFFVLRKHIESHKDYSREELNQLLKTRWQRNQEMMTKNKKRF
jgi:hypothetical protein